MIEYEKEYVLYLPEGVQFKVGDTYGKEVDGILYLFRYSNHEGKDYGCWKWVSTNKSLKEYNTILIKDDKDRDEHDLVKIYKPNWCLGKEGKKFYIYRYDYNTYYLSYNKPVLKHHYLHSGERVKLDVNKYPFIKVLLAESNIYEFEYKEL